MAPPPPPFYPEADGKDGEARMNAISTAITRLARVLGLGKDQEEAESVSERSPSIPIGGADEESYVLLDKPSEASPIRTAATNMRKTFRMRSVIGPLPEDMGNSERLVGSALQSVLPPTPVVPSVSGRGIPAATPAYDSLTDFGMLCFGIGVILSFMSILAVCHLFLLSLRRRRRVGGGEVSEGWHPGAPAAAGDKEGVYRIRIPECQTARSVHDGGVDVSMPPPRYEVVSGEWQTSILRGGRDEGSFDLEEEGV